MHLHKMLHKNLDMLAADWIDETGGRPSEGTILDLMEWSHKQITEPADRHGREDTNMEAQDVVSEIWKHNKSGKMLMVYERNGLYVRYHLNYNSDMQLQKHAQLPWHLFHKNHTFLGTLVVS